jgi:hypothetical protein
LVGRIPYDTVVTEAMVQGRPVTEALKEMWSRVRDLILSDRRGAMRKEVQR